MPTKEKTKSSDYSSTSVRFNTKEYKNAFNYIQSQRRSFKIKWTASCP